MATQNALVAIYENHVEAEKAVKELQEEHTQLRDGD